MAEPEPTDLRELLHQVANLVAVIQTQSAAARAEETLAAARRALDLIEDCARRTELEVRRFRARS